MRQVTGRPPPPRDLEGGGLRVRLRDLRDRRDLREGVPNVDVEQLVQNDGENGIFFSVDTDNLRTAFFRLPSLQRAAF